MKIKLYLLLSLGTYSLYSAQAFGRVLKSIPLNPDDIAKSFDIVKRRGAVESFKEDLKEHHSIPTALIAATHTFCNVPVRNVVLRSPSPTVIPLAVQQRPRAQSFTMPQNPAYSYVRPPTPVRCMVPGQIVEISVRK